jgi:tRNA(Ile)-lysidine synthetase-like protein
VPRRPPAVARVLERVTKTAREHEMFEPGDLVLVSCSGGPDSVSLLYSLWHLRRLFKIKLAVFHFDHQLRPDSARDAAYVRRLADRLELPFHLREADDAPLKGGSIEAWAREARQMAAQDVAEDAGAARIAEGHTLDDQAETVLMAAIKGSGLFGLMGIWPAQGPAKMRRVQPMIDVSRDEVEAMCRALRLHPRRDPTNQDRRFLRNALRLDVIPAIERATGRDVRQPLSRVAAEVYPVALEQLMKQPTNWRTSGRSHDASGRRDEWFAISMGLLEDRSELDAKVMIRGWLKQMHLPVSLEAINGILDLSRGRSGRRRDLPGGLKAIREREYVRVSRASPEN